jgi:hypothetical protein
MVAQLAKLKAINVNSIFLKRKLFDWLASLRVNVLKIKALPDSTRFIGFCLQVFS